MKKTFILFLSLIFSVSTYADEGMWLPINITETIYGQMRGLGLQLTADQIYSVNNASIKDAIVSLGGFCTGEIVSRQGLLLTNHHCAESSIQSHSSVEKDYLKNGFWAQTMEDELPNPGLFARFLVRMEDVTQKVMNNVTDQMTETERRRTIDTQMGQIVTQATQGTHYNAEIKPVFEGNKYYMFIYETYNDVRLVGAPPTSIGYYGGETDNWTWPRHTGDFALFRVYMSPDGKPAAYSPENIPLKPKHHLPISVKGYSEHDFVMIMGFPGNTRRYATSYSLNMSVNETNPNMIKIMQTRQDILKQDMQDEEVRIKYHSKFFTISNALKYYQGQTTGIVEQNLIEERRQLENEFQQWAQQNSNRKETYGGTINLIDKAYDSLSDYNVANLYTRLTLRLVEILSFANSFSQLPQILANADMDKEQISQTMQKFQPVAEEFYDDYNPPTDQKVFAALFKLYKQNVQEQHQPEFLQKVNDFDQWASTVFNSSIFASKEKLKNFLDSPTLEAMKNDTVYQIAQEFTEHMLRLRNKMIPAQSDLDKGNRLFVRGLIEMFPNRDFYPDANSTMRLTYGTIKGYSPTDAVTYEHYTTTRGLIYKHRPGDEEFEAPDKLLDLIDAKQFGNYAKNDTMKLNFLSNTDITGGNSGSPVLNAKGELIGVAFDGNWEAMSSDIAYIPELQRTISADIRYVLFIMDKYANARHLIDEMDIVGEEKSVPAQKTKRSKKEKIRN